MADLSIELSCGHWSRPSPGGARQLVCGVDEAGRGPWAGPVVAAAVILDPARVPAGLDDSKKLSPARREQLAAAIRSEALAFAIAEATVAEIDRLNILSATLLAMGRAVEGLAARIGTTPDQALGLALVDGNRAPALTCPVRTLVGGDGLSASVAAASILAKTVRDRHMVALDASCPGYGFAAHKGYGVAAHAAALDRLGPSIHHRTSFKPVAEALARQALARQSVAPHTGADDRAS